MHSLFMSRLQWQLQRTYERLGWLGHVALALLLASAIAYAMLLRPLATQLVEINQSSTIKAKQVLPASVSNATRLNGFLAALPPVANRAVAIKSLMDIAAAEDLLLDEVAYKTYTKSNDAINHYHVEFSLIASYPEIQHFLSSLLNQLPFVSIESLAFNRDSAQDDVVDARIHLVFHFNQ